MLDNAIKERDQAKEIMNSLKKGSKAWIEAEENLNFWQSKVANFEALAKLNK